MNLCAVKRGRNSVTPPWFKPAKIISRSFYIESALFWCLILINLFHCFKDGSSNKLAGNWSVFILKTKNSCDSWRNRVKSISWYLAEAANQNRHFGLSNVACISFGEFLVVFCRLLWISDFVYFNSQDHMWASSRPHTTSSFIICFKRPVLCLLYSWSFMIPVKRHESLRLVSLKFLPAALSFTTSLQTDFRCFSEAVPWMWSFLSSWYAPACNWMS